MERTNFCWSDSNKQRMLVRGHFLCYNKLMDWNSIIIAVLAVFASYVGNVTISFRKKRADELKDVERETAQAVQLKAIEQKLDIHNGYAQRLEQIEKSLVAMQKDIEFLRKEKS